MQKKYIIRLTTAERATLDGIVGRLAGSSQKVRRVPRTKVLDGDQEAKVIALRLGPPPTGFAN